MINKRSSRFTASCAALIAGMLIAAPSFATEVLMRTSLGDIRIDLFEEESPITVANFLEYVREGTYEQGIIHRSDPDFVLQGGGYQLVGDAIRPVETRPPIQNEPGISNQRGTIAMAKVSGNPDSATSQWFFNLADNSFLDSSNGGFTVFGEVSEASLAVLDALEAIPVFNIGQPFTEIPLRDFLPPGDSLEVDNFVVLSVEELSEFEINPGLNDAWFNPATSGQGFFLGVFPNSSTLFLSWFTYDVDQPDPGATAEFGAPGQRWITAQGTYSGDRVTLNASLTSGGAFDSGDPAPVRDNDYGTIELVFAGCNEAQLTYNFPGPGLSGTIPIRRVVMDNVALCEALAEDAATR